MIIMCKLSVVEGLSQLDLINTKMGEKVRVIIPIFKKQQNIDVDNYKAANINDSTFCLQNIYERQNSKPIEIHVCEQLY